MGTVIKSDGFRMTLSGISVTTLIAIVVFAVRIDAKGDRALEKFEIISKDVSALRQEVAKDRDVLHEHSAELREHRVMINELQRKSGTRQNQSAEWWGGNP